MQAPALHLKRAEVESLVEETLRRLSEQVDGAQQLQRSFSEQKEPPALTAMSDAVTKLLAQLTEVRAMCYCSCC
jgi:hypothetical protein